MIPTRSLIASLVVVSLVALGGVLLVGSPDYPEAETMPSPETAENAIVHETPRSAVRKVAVGANRREASRPLDVIEYPDRQVLELRIGPYDLEKDAADHYRSPIQYLTLPFDGYLHGFDWKLTATAPQSTVPDRMLHHFNIVSPNTRELFVPMAQRLAAAGRETPGQSIPTIVGRPFSKGEVLLAVGKFHRATEHDWKDVVLHIYLHYTRTENRTIQPWAAQPFYLDVMSPTGQDNERGRFQKDFAVPPGRTVKTWEGRPGTDGRIVGLGGHLHDFGKTLRLEDLTTGEVLWEVHPKTDEDGHVLSMPSETFLWSAGIELYNDHRYRLTAVYENPLDEPSPHRGMGAMGGLFIPSASWPEADTTHRTYSEELTSFMR